MNTLIENLLRLGPKRLVMLGGLTVATVAFILFAVSRVTAPGMGLLFNDLSPQDSGQIVSRLEALGVPYQLAAGGAQILVPEDRALRLRMTFAEQGLPRGGSVGYEVFDRSDSLGASTFMQGLNHVRALEGELARTIGALAPVQAARVHLVMPKREIFARERQEPTASVVLRLRGAMGLERGQIQAIQHLVAAAVSGLKPSRVAVIDDRGTMLARGQSEGEDGAASAASSDEMRRAYEQRVARSVESLLERTLGPGRVRAEVNADMDFDRVVTNSETFDPEGQVARQTQSVTESTDSSEAAGSSAVSVTSNLPDADGGNQAPRSATRTSRTEENTSFEVSKTTKSQVREGGVVRRMSVAVVIDNAPPPAGAAPGTAGAARSAEEMQRITALVRSAIGFNAQRGDTLEVTNLPFIAPEPVTMPESFLGLDLGKQDYFKMAELAALAIVGLLVVLLVARPMVANLTTAPALAGAAAGGVGGLPALPGAGGTAALAAPVAGGAPSDGGEPETMIDVNRIEGRVRASSLKKIGEIVEKHPEEAVAIMRSWMYEGK